MDIGGVRRLVDRADQRRRGRTRAVDGGDLRRPRTMPFVGMVTGGDLWIDTGQGCFYLFHDPGSGLSAVVYRQS